MTAPTDPAEPDLAHLEPTARTKTSAALHGMSGVLTALAGVQFVTSASFYDPIQNALPWSLAVLGVVQVVVALLVLRNHHPAALAGSLLAAVIALGALAWLVLSLTSGMLSFLAIVAVPVAGCAALLAPAALAHTRRGWDAKKRLEDAGMELGL
jgi:hypothetical protein